MTTFEVLIKLCEYIEKQPYNANVTWRLEPTKDLEGQSFSVDPNSVYDNEDGNATFRLQGVDDLIASLNNGVNRTVNGDLISDSYCLCICFRDANSVSFADGTRIARDLLALKLQNLYSGLTSWDDSVSSNLDLSECFLPE